ncbi:hypothetical protein G7084_07580 [Weissella coleopterorum]|uniref:Uncharacterized protein n=1 Tax=Weissella coleopterorum TaxID=2714949 RepID=A0A6G8B1F1_9LACO|nr:hypothetical protein [Weissella coleopterorum]QIL51161.1 hypothetical protein G7084_07580 [Weissella coleopterorum]
MNTLEDFEQIIGGVLQHQHIYHFNSDFEDRQQVCREKIWRLLQQQPDLKAKDNPYLFMILINIMRDFGRKQARTEALQAHLEGSFKTTKPTNNELQSVHFAIDLAAFEQMLPTAELKIIFQDIRCFPDAKINERCQRLGLARTTFKRRQKRIGRLYLRWLQE